MTVDFAVLLEWELLDLTVLLRSRYNFQLWD